MSARSADSAAAWGVAPPPSRRRSFVANRQEDGSTVGTPPPAPREEDIPVLTEVVDELQPSLFADAPPADEPPASEPQPLLPVPDASPAELSARMILAIQERMAYELPTLVEAALLSASEELRKGIVSTVEAALRDFDDPQG